MIGLDLGTTTVTGVLLDLESGEILHLARQRNDAALPSPLPGRAEQDPRRLQALALEVLVELASTGLPVEGVALTGQKHGLLCIDAAAHPLTPLVSWQDQRTAQPLPGGLTTLDLIHARLADQDWRQNGCRLAHGYGAATLFWMVQNGELPPAAHQVCTVAGWLAGQLVGQMPPTDPTFAASWGVYSLVDGTWNATFLERLDLEARLFPEVRPAGERLGGLIPEIARQVGLPPAIPVFNPLGDTQAAFLGACLPPRAGAGWVSPPDQTVFFNLGTGGQVCWLVPEFEPPSEAVEIRPLLPGRFLRVGASLCGGAAYAWLNRTVRAWLAEFGLELGEEAVYERLNALAEASQDAKGLQVRTTFLGIRGDPTVRSGAIEGISLENLQLGPLTRATLAGIVDELYGLYQAHASETAHHQQVIASGGVVEKNPLLAELIGQRFGLPVRVPPQRETAAVGAVLAARHATG